MTFQPGKGRVNVVSGLRDRVWVGYCLPFAVEQEMFVQPDENGLYHIRILRAKGYSRFVCQRRRAVAADPKTPRRDIWVSFAYDGDADFTEIQVREV